METVKVDIRKLQLLNDRINQCIDALNQVRLSTHGLSHTQGFAPAAGFSPFAPYQAAQATIPGLGQAVGGFQSPQVGFNPGLGIQQPFTGYGVNPIMGLGHTSLDPTAAFRAPIWADPILASRIAQTFPYAQAAVPPVVLLY